MLEKARKTLFKTIVLGDEGEVHFKYSKTSRDLAELAGHGSGWKITKGTWVGAESEYEEVLGYISRAEEEQLGWTLRARGVSVNWIGWALC